MKVASYTWYNSKKNISLVTFALILVSWIAYFMYGLKVKVTSTTTKSECTKSNNSFVFSTNTWDKALFLLSYPPSAILVAMLSLKNDRKVAVGGSILFICHSN